MAMKQSIIKKLEKTETYESNEAYLKVLYWFFSFPEHQFSLNDIAEELNISKTTAKRVINELIIEGFLSREVIGRIWRVSCNQTHKYNNTRKIAYNLNMVYESEIVKIIHDIMKTPRFIILFGSYRKGDDNEKSDIDIAVEVLGDQNTQVYPLGIIPNFGYRKNVQVNIHVFSRNKIDLNLFANIANGIVLEGFLEVRP